MRVIQNMNKGAEQILGKQVIESESGVRFLTYCIAVPCEEGILLHNVLTKELILLEGKEASSDESGLICTDDLSKSPLLGMAENDLYRYLLEHWYLVPADNADRELCDNTRTLLKHFIVPKEGKGIISFTILTTTDCNARCFYCYERGCEHTDMSPETAEKTIEFIRSNYELAKASASSAGEQASEERNEDNACECKKEGGVFLRWFGGEPLCNTAVIDQIVDGLTELGIPYNSSMISNAYLFDDATVKRAVEKWKLNNIQITLDGTEEIYNRRKAYVYEDGESAFVRVTDNIKRLLDVGIAVSIRMNLDEDNFEDMMDLAEILAERFGKYKIFSAYPRYLFNTEGFPLRGDIAVLSHRMLQLQERLRSAGLIQEAGLPKSLSLSYCMADSDRTVMIMTDGSLGKCEHNIDSRICGSVETGILDMEEIARWKVPKEPDEVCDACPHYPDCYMIRDCLGAYEQDCFLVPALKEDNLNSLRRAVLSCYDLAKKREEES